ncbi:MAG: hypothetical protein M1834_000777 [Cirrosporium novae-zelandiae]|nr:MAG: hypothetical protein M1834_000777 [Cirrosporium novae-zelandiae]
MSPITPSIILFLIGLILPVFCSPTKNVYTKTFNANFDNLKPSPVHLSQLGSPQLNPYDGLSYLAFGLDKGISDQATGLHQHSDPNLIGTGPTTQMVQGTLPTLTTLYEGSTVSSFDMRSCWMGCLQGTLTALVVSVPVDCTLLFKGYTSSSNTAVAKKYATFEVGSLQLDANMVEVVFDRSAFKGLTNLTVELVNSTAVGIYAMLFDNFNFMRLLRRVKAMSKPPPTPLLQMASPAPMTSQEFEDWLTEVFLGGPADARSFCERTMSRKYLRYNAGGDRVDFEMAVERTAKFRNDCRHYVGRVQSLTQEGNRLAARITCELKMEEGPEGKFELMFMGERDGEGRFERVWELFVPMTGEAEGDV